MHKFFKILLAEDDPDDSFLFQEALNNVNHEITLEIVQDGELLIEALDKKTEIPDIIFMDLNMPRKDGYSCLREIRSVPLLKKIPVVILSTSANEQSVENAYDGGANLYIRKPDNFNDLVKAIQICIENSNDLTKPPPKESFLLVL